jgi:hypothetical protein
LNSIAVIPTLYANESVQVFLSPSASTLASSDVRTDSPMRPSPEIPITLQPSNLTASGRVRLIGSALIIRNDKDTVEVEEPWSHIQTKQEKMVGFRQLSTSLSAIHGKQVANISINYEVMKKVLAYLEENGLEAEGIFRVSGDKTTIQKIWRSFQTGDPDLMIGSKYEIANALKSYLKNAPESLIPPSVYQPILTNDEGN